MNRLNNRIETWEDYLKAEKTSKPQRRRKKKKNEGFDSPWEEVFAQLWESHHPTLDLYVQQRIIPDRRFRFDFVHLEAKVAIEINGQIWLTGAHNTGTGLLRDYEKGNLAASLGWLTFNLAPEQVTLEWLKLIAKTIRKRLEGEWNYTQSRKILREGLEIEFKLVNQQQKETWILLVGVYNRGLESKSYYPKLELKTLEDCKKQLKEIARYQIRFGNYVEFAKVISPEGEEYELKVENLETHSFKIKTQDYPSKNAVDAACP